MWSFGRYLWYYHLYLSVWPLNSPSLYPSIFFLSASLFISLSISLPAPRSHRLPRSMGCLDVPLRSQGHRYQGARCGLSSLLLLLLLARLPAVQQGRNATEVQLQRCSWFVHCSRCYWRISSAPWWNVFEMFFSELCWPDEWLEGCLFICLFVFGYL